MNRLYVLVIILVTLMFSLLHAQTYQLNGFIGGGYGRFITDMELSDLDQNGYTGTFRIMWQPEHLLRVGLETGYYHLYSFKRDNLQTEFGMTDAHSSLSAVPLFLNMAMQVWESFEIFAGAGPTFLHTAFESFGSKTNSTQISTSSIVGGTYTYNLSEKVMLGLELKYYSISKIEDSSLTLQLMLKYRLLMW